MLIARLKEDGYYDAAEILETAFAELTRAI